MRCGSLVQCVSGGCLGRAGLGLWDTRFLFVVAACLAGCAGNSGQVGSLRTLSAPAQSDRSLLEGCVFPNAMGPLSTPSALAPDDSGDEGSGALGVAEAIVFYLPNRLLDFGDVVRFGINVGPGIGLDVQASEAARAAAITDTSVGVGFQTLRRLPVCARSRTLVAVGPVETPSPSLLGWRTRFWDMGGEAHALLIGAHAYVNPLAVLDAAVGILGFDPSEDDLGLGL